MISAISVQNFIKIYEDHTFLGGAVHNRVIGWPPFFENFDKFYGISEGLTKNLSGISVALWKIDWISEGFFIWKILSSTPYIGFFLEEPNQHSITFDWYRLVSPGIRFLFNLTVTKSDRNIEGGFVGARKTVFLSKFWLNPGIPNIKKTKSRHRHISWATTPYITPILSSNHVIHTKFFLASCEKICVIFEKRY